MNRIPCAAMLTFLSLWLRVRMLFEDMMDNYRAYSNYVTVSQNLKSHMNEGQRLNYILDRSLYDSKMIEGEKSIFYRPVF